MERILFDNSVSDLVDPLWLLLLLILVERPDRRGGVVPRTLHNGQLFIMDFHVFVDFWRRRNFIGVQLPLASVVDVFAVDSVAPLLEVVAIVFEVIIYNLLQ